MTGEAVGRYNLLMSDLIKRHYRVRKDQDQKVKKLSKRLSKKEFIISESEVVRQAIDGFNPEVK